MGNCHPCPFPCCCLCCCFHAAEPSKAGRNGSRRRMKLQLIVLGVDGAGKTHCIKRIRGEAPLDVQPSIGFSSSSFVYNKDIEVSIYDVGGSKGIRGIWYEYLAECHAVVYIVDVSAVDRLEESVSLLRELAVREDVKGKPILLLLNRVPTHGFDEIAFVDSAGLHNSPFMHEQPFHLALVSEYNGYLDNDKPPYASFVNRHKKVTDQLIDGFDIFAQKVINNFESLDVGVAAAKRRLEERIKADKQRRAARATETTENPENDEAAVEATADGNTRQDTTDELDTADGMTIRQERLSSDLKEEERESDSAPHSPAPSVHSPSIRAEFPQARSREESRRPSKEILSPKDLLPREGSQLQLRIPEMKLSRMERIQRGLSVSSSKSASQQSNGYAHHGAFTNPAFIPEIS